MSRQLEFQVIVYSVKRGSVSAMGNPSYVFKTDKGEYRTQTDSGVAYSLENDFPINTTLDRPVTLVTTPAGRVISWKLEA
jgi:hypothetical protein